MLTLQLVIKVTSTLNGAILITWAAVNVVVFSLECPILRVTSRFAEAPTYDVHLTDAARQ